MLDSRWKVTEETLRRAEPKIRGRFTAIFDDINNLYRSLDMTRETLNKVADRLTMGRLNRQLEKWEESGVLKGYFKFLVENTKPLTYYNVLTLLVYGTYYEHLPEIAVITDEVFDKVTDEVYKQVKKETKGQLRDPDKLKDYYLVVPRYNCSFDEYLTALGDTFSEETLVILLMFYEQQTERVEFLKDKILKQENRIIRVKDDRYSGMLSNQARLLYNSLYVSLPVYNHKVLFIAELDERTTEMCRSLDGQLFNTNEINEFDRYSESAGGMVHYSITGMQVGVNLPPIGDNFHWCRSIVSYVSTDEIATE